LREVPFSTFDEIFIKFIWRLHNLRTHLSKRHFPKEGLSLPRFTEEDLLIILPLSKPCFKVTFPSLQWLILGLEAFTSH
jgi:hypothetical protein